MLSKAVLMAKDEGRSGEFTASKQAFASPLKTTWFHILLSKPAILPRAKPQIQPKEVTFMILTQILMGMPR